MVRRQIVTTSRNRRKVSVEKPVTGTVPVVESVAAVMGEANRLEITFSAPVILTAVPPWPAMVGGSPVAPVGLVAQSGQSITLDYGEDVSTATHIEVPVGDQSVRSYSAQRVPPGTYPLA